MKTYWYGQQWPQFQIRPVCWLLTVFFWSPPTYHRMEDHFYATTLVEKQQLLCHHATLSNFYLEVGWDGGSLNVWSCTEVLSCHLQIVRAVLCSVEQGKNTTATSYCLKRGTKPGPLLNQWSFLKRNDKFFFIWETAKKLHWNASLESDEFSLKKRDHMACF